MADALTSVTKQLRGRLLTLLDDLQKGVQVHKSIIKVMPQKKRPRAHLGRYRCA